MNKQAAETQCEDAKLQIWFIIICRFVHVKQHLPHFCLFKEKQNNIKLNFFPAVTYISSPSSSLL